MTQVRVRSKISKQEARARALKKRPPWVETSTRGAAPTPDMLVTHINQTHDRMVSLFFNRGPSHHLVGNGVLGCVKGVGISWKVNICAKFRQIQEKIWQNFHVAF